VAGLSFGARSRARGGAIRTRTSPTAALLLVLALGCDRGQPTSTSTLTAPVASPTGVGNTGAPGEPVPLPSGLDCGSIVPSGATWPDGVPADLPQPPGAAIGEVTKDPGGLVLVQFATPGTLREGVVFVLCTLPKAGYVLGRGDAELTEADTPFQKGRLHGLYRVTEARPGELQWLLALQEDTSVPFAPGGGTPTGPTTAPPTFG
jgi:hypothetical protein